MKNWKPKAKCLLRSAESLKGKRDVLKEVQKFTSSRVYELKGKVDVFKILPILRLKRKVDVWINMTEL